MTAGGGGRQVERAVVMIIAISICLSSLRYVLPRLLPALVILGILVGVLRLIFHHTRDW